MLYETQQRNKQRVFQPAAEEPSSLVDKDAYSGSRIQYGHLVKVLEF